jgi:hypothetical protein
MKGGLVDLSPALKGGFVGVGSLMMDCTVMNFSFPKAQIGSEDALCEILKIAWGNYDLFIAINLGPYFSLNLLK